MNAMLNLVAVPFQDWKKSEREGFRTRDSHLLQKFGQHPQVSRLLVINRPISLSEIVLYRRSWRPRHGKLVRRRGGTFLTQVGPKTYTLDIVVPEVLRPLAMHRAWTAYIFGRPQIATAVRAGLADLEIADSYALFLSAPIFVPLARQLNPPLLIADAQDNLLKHAFYRKVPGLQAYYDYYRQHADLLSANSRETTSWLGREDATHISNGVDADVFSPTRRLDTPTDLSGLRRPIVGYAGKMQEMFDTALMERLLKTFPDVSFVCIGQQLNKPWMAPVWKHPNAHYLGDKPYAALPSYLAGFDICIIPYAAQRQHGGDPIKFYEYLSMGKPIVTTRIGGVGAFADYPQVCVADDEESFVEGLGRFIAMVRAGEAGTPRSLPHEYTWEAKADQIVSAALRKLSAVHA